MISNIPMLALHGVILEKYQDAQRAREKIKEKSFTYIIDCVTS
jgi:hypothetical protein